MRQQPSGSVRSRSSVLNAPHLRLAETVPRPAVGAAAAKQRRSPPLLAAAPNTAAAQTAGRQLLEAVQGTERGVTTSADTQKKIMALVEDLKHAGAGSKTVDSVSATWRLVWTTEKESLWIIKNAGLFGTKAGEVYQVIDTSKGILQNVITFPPQGAFIVDSGIAVDGPQRITFKFTSAKLKLPSRDFKLPPFGQGWFDTVYCDDSIRVAQDIRGDTLVVERDGPPRIFT